MKNILVALIFTTLIQSSASAGEQFSEICESTERGEVPEFCEEDEDEDETADPVGDRIDEICEGTETGQVIPSFCEDYEEVEEEMEEENDTNPACAMVICLSAPTLNNSAACLIAQKEFFAIKAKVLGVPSVSRTIKKRTKALNSCKGSRAVDTAAIIAIYGAIIY